ERVPPLKDAGQASAPFVHDRIELVVRRKIGEKGEDLQPGTEKEAKSLAAGQVEFHREDFAQPRGNESREGPGEEALERVAETLLRVDDDARRVAARRGASRKFSLPGGKEGREYLEMVAVLIGTEDEIGEVLRSPVGTAIEQNRVEIRMRRECILQD